MYSIYSKSLPFTSISYLQESFKLNEINHGKSVFLYWWFFFDQYCYLISGGKNTVLHTSVENFLCTLRSVALAKKSCNNIKFPHASFQTMLFFVKGLKLKLCKFLQPFFTPCELDCFCLQTLKHFVLSANLFFLWFLRGCLYEMKHVTKVRCLTWVRYFFLSRVYMGKISNLSEILLIPFSLHAYF